LENINTELFPFIENNKNNPNNSNEEKKKDIKISYPKSSYKDFELLKLLGIGSIGHILLVRFISNNQLYAMKKY